MSPRRVRHGIEERSEASEAKRRSASRGGARKKTARKKTAARKKAKAGSRKAARKGARKSRARRSARTGGGRTRKSARASSAARKTARKAAGRKRSAGMKKTRRPSRSTRSRSAAPFVGGAAGTAAAGVGTMTFDEDFAPGGDEMTAVDQDLDLDADVGDIPDLDDDL